MADNGGYDPCECYWSHEQAMRRLISLLRSSQGYCTSDECYQDMPIPANAGHSGGDDTFLFFTMMWFLLAVAMYFLRPSSLFQRGDTKPSNNQGPRQPPPDTPAL